MADAAGEPFAMGGSESSSTTGGARRRPADWNLAGFDAPGRVRLVFGNGSIGRLPGLIREIQASRVLLVTDPGIVRAGHSERVGALLRTAGCEIEVFDKVLENPDTVCVDACVSVARAFRPDALVAVGGGSSMDTAKGCNFLFTNGGQIQDYWGVGKARLPMLPFLAVPTTSGTGSECQSAALIADSVTHAKMACLDVKVAARVAILDPELTVSQPRWVTACTGVDAISHAVETAVTTKRNPMSLMFSREAFRLLMLGISPVLASPRDLEARGRMLLGAALAGTAIEHSMLGAAHAAANSLTAHFGIAHGVAVGAMLPHVVRFNARDPEVARAYAELASAAELARVSDGVDVAVDALVSRLEVLLRETGMQESLWEAGVGEGLIPRMADEAAKQWTASFNPCPVGAADFEELYRAVLRPRAVGVG